MDNKLPYSNYVDGRRKILDFGEIITPDIQRTISQETVDAIIATEQKSFVELGKFTLSSTIFVAAIGRKEYVIDGQHRLAAYRQIAADFPDRARFLEIKVGIYEVDTMENLEKLYHLVNMCNPHPIVELGVDKFKLWVTVEKYFKDHFGSYIKNTDKPVSPHISLAAVRKKFEERKVLDFNWKDDELVLTIDRLNKFYANITATKWSQWRVNYKSLAVIAERPSQLYLGLYRAYEWVDRIIDTKALGYIPPEHPSATCRIQVARDVKEKVWARFSGMGGTSNCQINGCCFCCGIGIKNTDFICGHVVAVSRGGPSTEENIRPVCVRCNSEMGSMNMMEYIELRKKQML